MSSFSYFKIEPAKDGNLIPVCKNSETGAELSLHSKYNPIREAESFAQSTAESSFFVVLGLAGGYHIASLLNRFPKSKILVDRKSVV